MRKLLSADFARLWKSSAFWGCLVGMILLAVFFMTIQYTAMDYEVPLSRVIFLPLSLYGVAVAALVSVFTGTDFSDGFIRNKLLLCKSRSHVLFSHIIVNCVACIIIYLIVSAFAAGAGLFFFENDVKTETFLYYLFLGIGMSAAYGCVFSVVTLLCGNKTSAVIWCMGMAMVMLFLSLHTNQLLVQTEFKNGLPNPHYVDGFRRALYGVLHDLNPCGQAAQLSSWEVWNPVRVVICNLLWMLAVSTAGCLRFNKKDVK